MLQAVIFFCSLISGVGSVLCSLILVVWMLQLSDNNARNVSYQKLDQQQLFAFLRGMLYSFSTILLGFQC